MIAHAGLITVYDQGEWRGALIEGASGVGKSDLALRCLALGCRLVADDRTELWTTDGKLYGACPPAIAGLMEARGLGVIAPPRTRRFSQVALIVAALPPGETIDRMPDPPQKREMLGVVLPLLRLHALEDSAPLKLLAALSRLGAEL